MKKKKDKKKWTKKEKAKNLYLAYAHHPMVTNDRAINLLISFHSLTFASRIT